MTPQALSTLITQARQTAKRDRSLWTNLLASAAAQPQEMKRMLWDYEGIDVLEPAQIKPAAQALPTDMLGPGIELIKTSTGQTRLLCADPWSAQALEAFTRLNDGQTALAIAATVVTASTSPAPAASQPAISPISSYEHSAPEENSRDVVQFVDTAIHQASAEGASDIHFECSRQGVGIKYRLDGVMVAGPRLSSPELAEQVISRIKVLAELDITERRKPQDGRFRWFDADGSALDLRVSIMPSVFGEDAVLRLLDKAQLRGTQHKVSLDNLGFEAAQSASIRELAAKPHGLLLVTGPTGSGKTTTLYATLSEVNTGIEKIVTIEDPVEYELAGVLQIPVNERKGLTFATGLRSILRHDPDKILVGEIRDSETAEIAIQAALTGHVVFTTVHANSLFDVLGRFQHFGIDPFAFASSLNGIVVQRLLRKLCPHCLTWRAPTSQEASLIQQAGLPTPPQIPCAAGCEHCHHTGYRGRFVIAQVHIINDNLRELILNKHSITQIKAEVERQQGLSLIAQAITQCINGRTSIEEITRVVGWS
jgi:general secretion pathway protein E